MGTNYYVHLPQCENPCIHCKGPEDIHLGKSSAGWAFTFRAYPAHEDSDRSDLGSLVVADFVSWRKLLDLGEIRDEYGRAVTADELLAKIEAKRGPGHRYHEEGYGAFRDADGNDFLAAEFS